MKYKIGKKYSLKGIYMGVKSEFIGSTKVYYHCFMDLLMYKEYLTTVEKEEYIKEKEIV